MLGSGTAAATARPMMSGEPRPDLADECRLTVGQVDGVQSIEVRKEGFIH